MRLIEIINELVVTDIEKTMKFYKEYLGFDVIETDGTPIVWVKMKKDNQIMMFEEYDEVCGEIKNFPDKLRTSNLIKFRYDSIEELEKLYNELLKHNVGIFMEWKMSEYGSVEFGILDPDDNMLILSF